MTSRWVQMHATEDRRDVGLFVDGVLRMSYYAGGPTVTVRRHPDGKMEPDAWWTVENEEAAERLCYEITGTDLGHVVADDETVAALATLGGEEETGG